MISKTDLKEYEFDSIYEYFDYVLASEVNGQIAQVLELILDMSKAQRKECFAYLKTYLTEDSQIVQNLIFKYI